MYTYCHCNITNFHFSFIFKNRPQRAKMRFWAKGRQGEKKTTRVKPAAQSEVSAFFAGSDMIPAHQFPDGKNRQRVEIVFLSFFTLSETSLFLLARYSNETGPGLFNPSLTL